MTPAVSVVLPVRDAAGTLGAAIESIRRQTWSDWELIVVDDGSTDGSGALARLSAAGDPRIRVLVRPAEGIVGALRVGLAAARGEFVARMDADDESHPLRLERQLAYLREHPETGLVSCLVEMPGPADQNRGYAAHVAWLNRLRTPEDMALHRFVESPVAHPSVVFRRELVARHGGYADGDFPEDYELWLRWLDRGVVFGKVPVRLLVWHDRPGRLSRSNERYRTEAFYRVKGRYLARWLEQAVAPERPLWLWGAGRITRRRFRPLEAEHRPLAGFVDIDPRKHGRMIGLRPVVAPEDIPLGAFVLAGVGSRGASEIIASMLRESGRVEGRDFLRAA